jgi:hypothetical protein
MGFFGNLIDAKFVIALVIDYHILIVSYVNLCFRVIIFMRVEYITLLIRNGILFSMMFIQPVLYKFHGN